MNVILTCGGTGGHINPALAVAKTIRARHPDWPVLFVGGEGGMEEKLVPKEGFDLKVLPAHSFRRSLTPVSIGKNVRTAVQLAGLVKKAEALVRPFAPDVVIGTGGYASFPTVRAAQKLGVPTVIHESNAVPGLTTKMLASKARRILVSFPDTESGYRHPERVRVVGTPVREEFLYTRREQARKELGIPENAFLVVTCWGSLGAREMNKKIADFILELSKRDDLYHIHACGSYGWRWMPALVREKGVELEKHPNIDLREYIYDMPRVMAAADLMICRAGASTLSEVAVAGIPAIIVPSPNVAGNHQEKNARVLERRGAAEVVLEADCTGEGLLKRVRELAEDPGALQAMKKALQDMAIYDAAERIYDALREVAVER